MISPSLIKINKGFLYPDVDAEDMGSFLEIAAGKQWEVGMVVLVGRKLLKNDVFAKIVGSGKKTKSVEVLLNSIEDYLRHVRSRRQACDFAIFIHLLECLRYGEKASGRSFIGASTT